MCYNDGIIVFKGLGVLVLFCFFFVFWVLFFFLVEGFGSNYRGF